MSYITNIADCIFIPEISHVEVCNVVLTRNSSPGWDEISAGIYKSYIDLYIKPLKFPIEWLHVTSSLCATTILEIEICKQWLRFYFLFPT